MKKSQLKKGKSLTDTIVENLKPDTKEYPVPDTTKGLYLIVKKTGAKSWKMRYKDIHGKWSWHGLGGYPSVSLANARLATIQKHKELALGVERLRVSKPKKGTFEEVLLIFQSEPNYQDLAQSTKDRNQATFDKHILPVMGKKPLKDITRADWLKLFKTIGENVHHITGKRTIAESHNAYMLVNRVYNFALNESLAGVESNPVTGLKSRLEKHESTEYAHITQDELPKLISTLHGIQSNQTRIGLLLLLHLYLRPTEILDGFWHEIDFKKSLWHIPAERMKKRRPHAIPLSRQVMALLKELHAITGNDERLFPSKAKTRKSARATFSQTLKRKGYQGEQTLHGFRHIASTALNDYTDENGNKFDERVIEFALAHKVQGVKGVYNKAEYLDDRKTLNQFYSDYLDSLQA